MSGWIRMKDRKPELGQLCAVRLAESPQVVRVGRWVQSRAPCGDEQNRLFEIPPSPDLHAQMYSGAWVAWWHPLPETGESEKSSGEPCCHGWTLMDLRAVSALRHKEVFGCDEGDVSLEWRAIATARLVGQLLQEVETHAEQGEQAKTAERIARAAAEVLFQLDLLTARVGRSLYMEARQAFNDLSKKKKGFEGRGL